MLVNNGETWYKYHYTSKFNCIRGTPHINCPFQLSTICPSSHIYATWFFFPSIYFPLPSNFLLSAGQDIASWKVNQKRESVKHCFVVVQSYIIFVSCAYFAARRFWTHRFLWLLDFLEFSWVHTLSLFDPLPCLMV